mmetsp:Transcript_1804/g.5437  ORF Transcript_1804/g.5437 Transcript_1804/m.5437 type:complete len:105 (-) Transcript_1804:101-415(-)
MNALGSGNADGTFPKTLAQCGRHSWSLFHGFRADGFASCISSRVGVSAGCSQCFAASGQYGYQHCKARCLFHSWCGQSCLDCVRGAREGLLQCLGVQPPTTTAC